MTRFALIFSALLDCVTGLGLRERAKGGPGVEAARGTPAAVAAPSAGAAGSMDEVRGESAGSG